MPTSTTEPTPKTTLEANTSSTSTTTSYVTSPTTTPSTTLFFGATTITTEINLPTSPSLTSPSSSMKRKVSLATSKALPSESAQLKSVKANATVDQVSGDLSSFLELLRDEKQRAQSREETLISKRLNDYRSKFELISSLKRLLKGGHKASRAAIEHQLDEFESSVKLRKLLSVEAGQDEAERRDG